MAQQNGRVRYTCVGRSGTFSMEHLVYPNSQKIKLPLLFFRPEP